MEMIITPFESVGPIQFGATPTEVQAAVSDSGIQARSLGIELYAPNYSELERPDEVVEGVMVVDRDYFEKTDALLAALGF
jgi:hypothetical protein